MQKNNVTIKEKKKNELTVKNENQLRRFCEARFGVSDRPE
jgi:hypothetical protein